MKNWLVQLLVDVGLVRPRDEVEGATASDQPPPTHRKHTPHPPERH